MRIFHKKCLKIESDLQEKIEGLRKVMRDFIFASGICKEYMPSVYFHPERLLSNEVDRLKAASEEREFRAKVTKIVEESCPKKARP